MREAYQVENGNFHHTLIEIRRTVLNDLDSHNFLRLEVLALDNLSKSTLTQHVKNKVTIPTSVSSASRNFSAEATYLWPASSEPKMSLTYRM